MDYGGELRDGARSRRNEHERPCPEARNIPLAIIPAYSSPRIVAQRGTFTVFGEDPFALEDLAIKDRRAYSAEPHLAGLQLFRVPATAIASMRDELDVAGITESVIYPDLGGLGAEIGRRYRP